MFIALGILVCGILAGKVFCRFLSRRLLSKLTLAAIFLLLFLLGTAIGSNDVLLASLPDLGLQSLAIMLCCVGGSIFVSFLVTPFLPIKSQNAENGRKTKINVD